MFDAASGEWVPNTTEELTFDNTWAAPERALGSAGRSRRSRARMAWRRRPPWRSSREDPGCLDAVGSRRVRGRGRPRRAVLVVGGGRGAARVAGVVAVAALVVAVAGTGPEGDAAVAAGLATAGDEASPLRVKQVARQRKAVRPPPAVVETAAPPSSSWTPAPGDWRVAGAQVATADDKQVPRRYHLSNLGGFLGSSDDERHRGEH